MSRSPSDAIYLGAGTRQSDAGFKLTGDDSNVPAAAQALVPAAAVDLIGADPQARAAGVWGFALARRSALRRGTRRG